MPLDPCDNAEHGRDPNVSADPNDDPDPRTATDVRSDGSGKQRIDRPRPEDASRGDHSSRTERAGKVTE